LGRAGQVVSVSEASEFSSEEIDALLARARSWEPMLTGSRRDLDQCVPIAAELTLRLPRGALPSIAVKRPDRFARWQERLLEAGYVIRDLDLDQLPPEDNRPWVAGIRIDERSDHAVAMLGHGLATIDPLETYRPRRFEDIIDAWRIEPR